LDSAAVVSVFVSAGSRSCMSSSAAAWKTSSSSSVASGAGSGAVFLAGSGFFAGFDDEASLAGASLPPPALRSSTERPPR
jgi:hypothetical protein